MNKKETIKKTKKITYDVAYNTNGSNLEEIVWEQDRYLSGAVEKMLKRLDPTVNK